MSRKDYIAIGEVLREHYNNIEHGEADKLHFFENITSAIANVFKRDNPRFDHEKFADFVYMYNPVSSFVLSLKED